MKQIKWLESFAEAEAKKTMTKTASVKKVAKQIIVNSSCFPSVKAGSFVNYENDQYKVIDDKFEDEKGAGIILERVADGSADNENSGEDSSMRHQADDGGEGASDEGGEGAEKIAQATPGDEYPTVELVDADKAAPSEELSNAEHTKSVTDAPYHPTANPGNAFAIDCPDTFQEAAEKTEEAIADEDAQDRTSVEGHYSRNKNRILDAVMHDVEEEEKEVPAETVVEETVEETPEDEVEVKETPEFEEEVFEELPEEKEEKEEKKAE